MYISCVRKQRNGIIIFPRMYQQVCAKSIANHKLKTDTEKVLLMVEAPGAHPLLPYVHEEDDDVYSLFRRINNVRNSLRRIDFGTQTVEQCENAAFFAVLWYKHGYALIANSHVAGHIRCSTCCSWSVEAEQIYWSQELPLYWQLKKLDWQMLHMHQVLIICAGETGFSCQMVSGTLLVHLMRAAALWPVSERENDMVRLLFNTRLTACAKINYLQHTERKFEPQQGIGGKNAGEKA